MYTYKGGFAPRFGLWLHVRAIPPPSMGYARRIITFGSCQPPAPRGGRIVLFAIAIVVLLLLRRFEGYTLW